VLTVQLLLFTSVRYVTMLVTMPTQREKILKLNTDLTEVQTLAFALTLYPVI